MALKVISGGQTGVDRAALDVALTLGLECGGWCPPGRVAEDGAIPEKYPLWELRQPAPHLRVERNVEGSSATLVITRGLPTGGARYAVEFAQSMRRPTMTVDVSRLESDEEASAQVAGWLVTTRPRILNVSGPKESGAPGISEQASRILARALMMAGFATQRPARA